MIDTRRVVSSVLLVVGVVLVLGGYDAALGFTIVGTLASLAAVVTLLYAGAVWFGRPVQPQSGDLVLVFDRALRVACGPDRGRPLLARFPPTVQAEIQAHCSEALAGQPARFSCGGRESRFAFEAVPIRGHNGTVIYGMLLSGAAKTVEVATVGARAAVE